MVETITNRKYEYPDASGWINTDSEYDRLFREWNELGYSDELMEKIFHGNTERILGL